MSDFVAGFNEALDALASNYKAGLRPDEPIPGTTTEENEAAIADGIAGFDDGVRMACGGEPTPDMADRSEWFHDAWQIGFLVGMTKLGFVDGEPPRREGDPTFSEAFQRLNARIAEACRGEPPKAVSAALTFHLALSFVKVSPSITHVNLKLLKGAAEALPEIKEKALAEYLTSHPELSG